LAYPGEIPVIDGNNYQLPTTYWGALLEIAGNYIQISGIEVRYSNWMGVALSGHHDLASLMNVHHSRETGMLVRGDYGIVENSRVWQNANRNEINSPYRSGGWATGLSAARHPNYAILRGNTIYNNWGEGLSTFEANGTIMQDNIVYDNWSANVYVSDSTNVTLQRNLVYTSDNSIIASGSRIGIALGDEVYSPSSSNITVINNLVYGGYRNFYWWQGVRGGGMVNVLIANNTFVNSRSVSGIQIDYGPHQNVRFYNNIVVQEGTLPIAGIDTANGIAFSHNLWSKRPPSIASGPGDVIADPGLARTGSYSLPAWYQLQASSPAWNTAIRISEVTDDFFRRLRGETPDMGAFEYAQ
jgi:parallel beta-helix repeat protein